MTVDNLEVSSKVMVRHKRTHVGGQFLRDVHESATGRTNLTTSFNVRGRCAELGEVPWCQAVLLSGLQSVNEFKATLLPR